MANSESQTLKERLYGGLDTGDITRKSQQAYQDILGLQGNNSRVSEVGQGLAKGLASSFIDAYHDQYNKLPSDQEVSAFISNKLNDSNFLAKGLQGTVNANDMYQLAKNDPSFIDAGVKAQQDQLRQSQGTFEQQAQANVEKQRSLADQLAQFQQQQTIDESNRQFGNARGRMISEAAASGRAYTPQTQQQLGQAEQENQRTLQQALSNIRAAQVGGQLGLEQQGQQNIAANRQFDVNTGLKQNEQGLQRQSLSEQIRQFNEGLGEQRRQANLQNSLAQQLGRMQADANGPGTLDYVNTAIGGLAALSGGAGAILNGIGAYRGKASSDSGTKTH